ncbi:PREDICTED: proline-rich protein 23A-like [Miniopterus natalensis]|uniref:proline-rich protein 23A-like n=1 Tax=Miniopterus natalensis TaxID=291302 RepID=UPI0007A70F6A|nr:PREDICTED: proline-rich protein 23A-like [Miniopterus natalensis]
MGSRLLSPSAHPAPWWRPQPGGPGPAKRPRAAAALTSVVVLAPGCALQLHLDGVDLVLQPEPTSVLQVSLGAHTLTLVPQALWGSGDDRCGGQAHSPVGLEPRALLGAPGEDLAVQQGFLYPRAPEIAAQEETYGEEADPEFLTPWMDAAAGSVPGRGFGWYPHSPLAEPSPQAPTPSPERRSPGPYFNLDSHLLEPFPNSPLQPLPPSPSPGPHERPQRPPGPARKARRRLFQE